MSQTRRLCGSRSRPDYGADGYIYMRSLLAMSVLLCGVTLVLCKSQCGAGPTLTAGGAAVLLGLPGLLGVLYVKRGKFHHRDRILAMIRWRGDEQVLDVGTGGGLMLIGAAQHVPTGRAIGIDIWNAADLSDNRRDRTLRNAELEGVLASVEVHDQDARELKFADGQFDVVLSVLCLHNLSHACDQEAALREIVRVLKKGGTAVIADLADTARYEKVLVDLGLKVVRSPPCLDTFPPQRIVQAWK